MGWPIDNGHDFEDVTFEYTPEELGIDPKNAAKIQEIKRLRPLSTLQPWGIFFIKFEPKRLPVVALRRILGQVALKKRASANSSERQAWEADDLLFVSNYGEGEERRIALAHFAKPNDGADLPTLKVLGWDNLDTSLHLDAIAQELTEHLSWPSDESDINAWRDQWRSAFVLKHQEVINTSKQLSERLAELARAIRDRIRTVLAIETETGPLTKLLDAFRTALVHDLDEAGFADMYAQTIAYGLLSARITDPQKRTADDFAAHMRTNPFLKELMETFLHAGGRRGKAGGPGIDFDELGVSEVVALLDTANMEAVIRDFGDRNPQEDPVIHFYEHFLAAYDKKQKVSRGVFYTPRPVVSYIVRSVDELLRTEFGLEDGLADTATWADMTRRVENLEIPDGTSPDQGFVQILDPATGTGTFLVEVIETVHNTLVTKWKAEGHDEKKIDGLWNEYVPKHLLTRLHGYELLMAPYAIAHLKVGLKLYETGYRFENEERARVFLTNALEPASDGQFTLGLLPALAHEARAVNEIKRSVGFTVVVGNPPYSVKSANNNSYIASLMDDYKKHVRGEQGLVALADDYLKFIRFSQELLRASGAGIWGMITNHGFTKGVVHRGVRQELLNQFGTIHVLDLHGDSNIGERIPEGRFNENVFDIQQGVAISIGIDSFERASVTSVYHDDLWGSREEKYQELSTKPLLSRKWTVLCPIAPQYLLVPFDGANQAEYERFPSIKELMPVNSCGVKTHRDGIVIDFDKAVLSARITDIASERRIELLRERYRITDTPHWKLQDAQLKIDVDKVPQFLFRITYRPFDNRWIYYNPKIIEKGDSKYPTLRHMLRRNVALLSARIQATGVFDAVFVSKYLVEMKTAESSRSCTVFPLFLATDAESQLDGLSGEGVALNLNRNILTSWAQKLGVKASGRFRLPNTLTPENVFSYTYAALHSPTYRNRYSEFLKTDFPRLPLTGNLDLAIELTKLGSQLTALHLMESPRLAISITEFVGHQNPKIEKVAWSENTVWIDKAQTIGFKGVPKQVWDFHIGGYQVCHKWLKDRKGRTLSDDDIEHYQKIVVALSETIRIMGEIDEVIEAHGGWPGAFLTGAEPEENDVQFPDAAEQEPSYSTSDTKDGDE
jgi:predicted helicase